MCAPRARSLKFLFVIGRVADLHTWKFVVESLRANNDLIQRLRREMYGKFPGVVFSRWRCRLPRRTCRGLMIKNIEPLKRRRTTDGEVWQFWQTKSVGKFGERWLAPLARISTEIKVHFTIGDERREKERNIAARWNYYGSCLRQIQSSYDLDARVPEGQMYERIKNS